MRPDRYIHIAINCFIDCLHISTDQADTSIQPGSGSPGRQTVTEGLIGLDLVIDVLYAQVLKQRGIWFLWHRYRNLRTNGATGSCQH